MMRFLRRRSKSTRPCGLPWHWWIVIDWDQERDGLDVTRSCSCGYAYPDWGEYRHHNMIIEEYIRSSIFVRQDPNQLEFQLRNEMRRLVSLTLPEEKRAA